MRCSVPSCKNDSSEVSKTQGVTFHAFPPKSSLRTAWLKALGIETWSPKKTSVVCSEHFVPGDLYPTQNGLRKVRSGAVPIVVDMQDASESDYDDSVKSKICRICLGRNVKLYPMSLCKLDEAYENLIGVMFSDEEELPQSLCVECATRLMNYDKLRKKSLRANDLLLEVIKKQKILTKQNLNKIDRENNNLTSTLTTKTFEPDHCDMYIEYSDKQTDRQVLDVKNNEGIYIIEIDGDPKELTDTNDDSISNDDENLSDDDENESKIIKDESNDNGTDDDDLSESDDSIKKEIVEKRTTRQSVKEKSKQNIDSENKDSDLEKTVKKIKGTKKIDKRKKPILDDDKKIPLFTVKDLTFEEQLEEIQKRQDTGNYKASLYKCTDCFKGFIDETAYNQHILRHTDQCGEHQCDVCKIHFKSPRAVRRHSQAHHSQLYKCNLCAFVTSYRHSARLHERWHKGKKYQCPHCQEEFVKFSTYMGHIRIKHPSDCVCALCGYCFVSEKGVEMHRILKHRLDEGKVSEEGPYCDVCEVRFASDEAYARHLKLSSRHTSSDDPDRPRNDPQYNRKRSDGKPVTCEQCGEQLENLRMYAYHFRRVHPGENRTKYPSMKPLAMCEQCGRIFQSMALLKDHMWVHTGERKRFKCDICEKSFTQKTNYMVHLRAHRGVRPANECPICGKRFSFYNNVKRHMLIHTGLKPYKCDVCGKGFTTPGEQKAHVKHVHLKEPRPRPKNKLSKKRRRSSESHVTVKVEDIQYQTIDDDDDDDYSMGEEPEYLEEIYL